MELTINLYGRLRELAPELDSTTSTIGKLRVNLGTSATVSDILDQLGLERGEVSHVFVDGNYSSLTRELGEVNKIALFPADMGLLYSWYFEEEE